MNETPNEMKCGATTAKALKGLTISAACCTFEAQNDREKKVYGLEMLGLNTAQMKPKKKKKKKMKKMLYSTFKGFIGNGFELICCSFYLFDTLKDIHYQHGIDKLDGCRTFKFLVSYES